MSVWRFAHFGVSIRSVRNMAIIYHFRHPLRFQGFQANLDMMCAKQSRGEYVCKNGLKKI
ncbi:MAG: hypothetical protein K6347_02120 [Campylobacterales bacterium]